jgi:uncharacterized Zn-finger protein
MGAREKIAYLKGIIDGQNLADTPEKAKFYTALTDALESLAAAMEEHENVHEELNDYLEQLDDDVAKLEDDFDECSCGDEDEDEDEDDEDDDLDEEEYASVTCPHCSKEFYYEPAMYGEDDELICPHCGKSFKCPEQE